MTNPRSPESARTRRATCTAGNLACLVACSLVGWFNAIGAQAWKPPANATPPYKLVSLEFFATDFAFDPESAAVLALDPAQKSVWRIDHERLLGRPVQDAQQTFERAPIAAVYKRYGDHACFVIACRDDSVLHVVDAATLAVLGQIPTDRAEIQSLLASSAPTDPYIYYVRGVGEAQLGCVNLKSMGHEGVLLRGVRAAAVSLSGKALFVLSVGELRSESKALTIEQPPESVGLVKLTEVARNRELKYTLPDRWDRIVSSPDGVFPVDSLTQLAKRQEAQLRRPICYFQDRPVIINWDSDGIAAWSYNTNKPWSQLKLPQDIRVPRPPPSRVPIGPERAAPYPTSYFASPSDNAVLVCGGRNIAVVPLEALNVQDQPFLHADIELPIRLPIDQPMAARVRPWDVRATLHLQDAPEGMVLDGQTLRWTPRADQLGPTRVNLRLKWGELERIDTMDLNVVRPSVTLPFLSAPSTSRRTSGAPRVSESGRTAVVWVSNQPDAVHSGPPTAEVAVIDLAKLEVRKVRTLLRDVADAALNDEHVYLAHKSTAMITALHTGDLTDAGSTHLSTPAETIALIGPNVLMARSRSSEPWSIFEAHSLSPLRDEGLPLGFSSPHSGDQPRRLTDGWYLGGCVFDSTLSQPLFVAKPPGMIGLTRDEPLPPSLWNRGHDSSRKLFVNDETVEFRSARHLQLLVDHPAALALTMDYSQSHLQVALEFCDLFTLKPGEHRVVLYNGLPLTSPPNLVPTTMQAVAGGVAVLFGNELFWVDTPPTYFSHCREPLQFRFPTGPISCSPESTSLTYRASGGYPPYSFELATLQEGIEIDVASGRLNIDSPHFHKTAATQLVSTLLNSVYLDFARMPERLEQHRTRIAERISTLFGFQPRGYVVLQPVTVRVRDSRSESAVLGHSVLIEIPQETVEQALADASPDHASGAEELDVEQLRIRVNALSEQVEELRVHIEQLTYLLQPTGDP